MSDDVRLGKISRRAEALRQLVEESEVEIDLRVGRTIKRSGRRFGRTACRLDGIAEQHDTRPLVAPAEQLRPGVLRVVHDRVDEVDHPLLGGRGLSRRSWTGGGARTGVGVNEENRFVPLTQLNTSRIETADAESGDSGARPPRASSILLRSPASHFMAASTRR